MAITIIEAREGPYKVIPAIYPTENRNTCVETCRPHYSYGSTCIMLHQIPIMIDFSAHSSKNFVQLW